MEGQIRNPARCAILRRVLRKMGNNDFLNWLYKLQTHGIKPGLERTKFLVEKLGKPQDDYQVIHVAGTNGKGSVCNFIHSILKEEGYKVGLYTSPHLNEINERIIVNGEKIPKKTLGKLIEETKPIVEKMIKKNNHPTFFEVLTAISLKHFSDEKVDYAVLETGMGGRFDATNVIEKTLVSVITNISLDHTNFLGEKIEDIAFEKAGIIKKNSIVVTGTVNKKVFETISKIAREKNTLVRRISKRNWRRLYFDLTRQIFEIEGEFRNYQVETKLLGKIQGENIAISIAAVEELQKKGVYISDNSIFNGIRETQVPGRMEILGEQPLILADGAHNSQGIKNLVETLNDFDFKKSIFVFGAMRDKDIKKMLSHISKTTDSIVLTKANVDRACNPEHIASLLKKQNFTGNIFIRKNVKNAVDFAIKNAGKNDLVCITGSLYIVGEARKELLKENR